MVGIKEILIDGRQCQPRREISTKGDIRRIKEHECEMCKRTTWNGQPIPLELHHIDGDRFHNVIENFQLLCPNCHALTDSYRCRNCRKS